MKNIPLLVLLTLLTAPCTYAAFPPEFKAEYTLNKFGLDAAQADISLKKQKDGSWLYLSQTKTRGIVSIFRSDKITEKSVLRIIDGLIKPVDYQYNHKGGGKNRNRTIHFNWRTGTAESNISGTQSRLAIPADTIENFSLQLRLMNDLQQGKRVLIYNIINKGKLKRYNFEILGNEKVKTPSGEFNAIKFRRTRKNSKRSTIMWAAPELHFLPVKIQHIEKDGATFYMLLSNVSGPITNGKSYSDTRGNEEE